MHYARHEPAGSVVPVDGSCGAVTEPDGDARLRIASVFIILAASALGAIIPIVLARKNKPSKLRELAFSICKYTGTGVIIGTAWMHLLVPAAAELSDPCLRSRLGTYPWAFGVALWTVMAMFAVEMLAEKFAVAHGSSHAAAPEQGIPLQQSASAGKQSTGDDSQGTSRSDQRDLDTERATPISAVSTAGEPDAPGAHGSAASQMLALFILEFGAIFHSFFVGLTLGTTRQLLLLLIVLVVHQLFEGLALGARLADAPWPPRRRFLRYVFVVLFAVATPVGTVVGMTAQGKDADVQKLLSGIFSAISAGILSYTGLVELLAGEFLFSPDMARASTPRFVTAFICVLAGVAVMSVLAVWA